MPAGRPRKYSSPEEMQKAIDLYFLACKTHQHGEPSYLDGLTDAEREVVNGVDDTFPSVTGLALVLGFTSRQSLIDYEERDEYFDTIKKAKLRIENAIEQRLFHANATGSIFNLKNNYGWVDKTEQDLTSKGESINKDATAKLLESLPEDVLERVLHEVQSQEDEVEKQPESE